MKLKEKLLRHWFLAALGALLLLIAAFLIEEHIRGHIALNRYVKQMRARGEKFTIAELTPTPVPPEKNGVGFMMSAGVPVGKVAPQSIPPAMRYIAPGVAVAAAREPVWAIQHRSTFVPTNGVMALWRTNTSTETPRIRGTNVPMLITSEDLRADVQAASNSLAQLHAAFQFPALDHGLDYSAGFNMRLPHLSQERGAANWLRAASLSALYETNHAVALQNLLALAAFAHLTTNEPLMISQLVRISAQQIGVGAVWEALQADGWTEEQLRELQNALQPADSVTAMSHALEMERAMGGAIIDRVSDDAQAFFALLDPNSSMTGQAPAGSEIDELLKNVGRMFVRIVYLPIWNLAWKDQDKLRVFQMWQVQIDAARTQARVPNWKTNRPQMDESGEETGWFVEWPPQRRGGIYDRIAHPFSTLLGANGTRSLDRAVDAEVAQELAISALALRRWQLLKGNLPAKLDELVPQFLPVVPVDPHDGQPLHYRSKKDGTFLLYSVGRDGRDNDGDAAPEKKDSKPQFLYGRDIVWPRAATQKELEYFATEAAAGHRRNSTAP